MADGGQFFFWKTDMGTVLHGVLMIRSCQGRGSSINAFFSNLKIVLLKFSPIMKEYSLEDKALTSLQNYRSIYT